MNLAAAPWRSAYPPGLAPDVELAAFPVHEIVEQAAARWGSKAAFRFRDTVLGYDALATEVERCAAAFMREGIASGSKVPGTYKNSVAASLQSSATSRSPAHANRVRTPSTNLNARRSSASYP